MSKMRRCIIPAILAAMALTALTACGGKSDSADATTAETTTEAATEASTEEETKEETTEAAEEEATEAEASGENSEYLEQVDTMNKAAEEFITVSMEFMQLAQDDPENIDALSESIEKTLASKQAFLDFSAIDTAPEG